MQVVGQQCKGARPWDDATLVSTAEGMGAKAGRMPQEIVILGNPVAH